MQGDAPFRFQWLKDGKLLDPSPLSLGVRSDDFSMDLTFSRVTPRHNGNYTCIASNDVASVSHSAILVVDGEFCPCHDTVSTGNEQQFSYEFSQSTDSFLSFLLSVFPDVHVAPVSCEKVFLRVCIFSLLSSSVCVYVSYLLGSIPCLPEGERDTSICYSTSVCLSLNLQQYDCNSKRESERVRGDPLLPHDD